MPLIAFRFLRWFLLLALALLAVAGGDRLGAQDQSKKAPPKEVEDPAAKGKTKAVPRIDDVPSKANPAPLQGPGVPPPPGTLVVAVHHLPELMSPTFARSDSERFALDLLFEGLLRPVADSVAGTSYEPALARELPRLVPRGREFALTDAVWADPLRLDKSELVTAADVRSTVAKLHERRGFGAATGDAIDSVYTAGVRDQCRVLLKHGHPDPLALMTFKVLPNSAHDDEAFARQPIGSGPFTYAGRRVEGGRTYALFLANRAYGSRPERRNLPQIAEVRLLESQNPVEDFRNKLAQFVLTTHTGELASLRASAKPDEGAQSQGRIETNYPGVGRVNSLPSRRIDFLAVNHRLPALGGAAGKELRRLIAHAIQRDAILTECFRAGYVEQHQPLDGPFPPGTWPCSPNAPRLDDAELAQSLASHRQAPVTLDLKYPAGEPAVEHACQVIKRQLAEFKIALTLTPLAPAELRRKVEVETDFHLAYWHYDYPDGWFSPTGLLDVTGHPPSDRGFMGYRPSPDFDQLLARCRDRRDFGELRRAMRQLHDAFRAEMPFIPLWHLDTHVLVADNLQIWPAVALLDPLAPFTHIDQWMLK